MKQLYYTWCDAGTPYVAAAEPFPPGFSSAGKGQGDGAEPKSGFHVRAASAGVEPFCLRAAAGYAGYALPPGLTAENAAKPPVRLALLSTSEAGRILCHCSWIGKTSSKAADFGEGMEVEDGRNGNFFAHLLLDVPPTLDVQHAIQTWGSPLWQREDDGGGTELPEMLSLPVADKLNDAALTKYLDHPSHRAALVFVLTALLSSPPRRRIFLAAPTEHIALCIYGVTRSLPAAMLEDFTFSTYEREPLSCQARMVGTCWADGPDIDFPSACYSDVQAAFNTISERKTELPAVPFAEFAVEALASGKPAALDEFRNTWQRLGVKDVGLLDLIYRMARGAGTLTKEESQQALQNSALAAWIATRNDALQQFLEWALDDTAYATATFSRIVVALRQKPDALARLAQTVQDLGLAALRAGDKTRCVNALEGILPMVAPGKAAGVWDEVLAKAADSDAVTWELRWYLLPKFAKLRPLPAGQAIDPTLAKWFRVPAAQLASLLALDLPKPYQQAAALESLSREGEASPIYAQALALHPTLVVPLIQQVAATSEERRGGQLFDAVLAEAPTHPWAEELLKEGRTLPPAFLDRCLESALTAGKLDAEHLVRNHGSLLLEHLAGKRSLDRLAGDFLKEPPADLITDKNLVAFLEKLAADTCLTADVRTRLDAALTLENFLRKPSLAIDELKKTAAALDLQPPLMPVAARKKILEKLAVELSNKAGAADVQDDLENVLICLGPQSEGGPATLYREILQLEPEGKLYGRQNELLHAFMAIALGAIHSTDLTHKVENLEGDAFSLAAQMTRRGRKKALARLDEKTAQWPKGARTQWTFLVKAVQPRGFQGFARDAAFFLAGAIVAGAAFYVLKMMGYLD